MVKAYKNDEKYDRKNYNRNYYQKNKERLLAYNQIYKTIQRDKNLEYLKKYYENVTKKEKQWDLAMPSLNTTRPKRTRVKLDRGPKVVGFQRQVGPITISFD